MSNPTVAVSHYDWGTLRVLERGISYKCVIHPEHVATVLSGGRFTDEQGVTWSVACDGERRSFKASCRHFDFSLAELGLR